MTFCLILPLCITTKTFQNRQLGCNWPARFQFKFNKNPDLTVWESQPDSIWCRNILQNLPRNNLHHYSNERHQIKTLFSLKNMHFTIHNTHNNSLKTTRFLLGILGRSKIYEHNAYHSLWSLTCCTQGVIYHLWDELCLQLKACINFVITLTYTNFVIGRCIFFS